MEVRPDVPQLGHLDAGTRQVNGRAGTVGAAVDGEGIHPRFFGLEPWILEGRRVPEEVQVRLAQILVNRTQRLTVHLFQEGRFLFIMGRGGDILQVRSGVELTRIGQHPVPQVPAAVEGFVHQLRLFRRGVEAELEDGVPACGSAGEVLAIFCHRYSSPPPGQVVYYLAGDFFLQLPIVSAPILKSLALNCKKFFPADPSHLPGQVVYYLAGDERLK